LVARSMDKELTSRYFQDLHEGAQYTYGTSLRLRIVEVEVLTDFVDHGRDNLVLDCLCVGGVEVLVRPSPTIRDSILDGSTENRIGADLHSTAYRAFRSCGGWHPRSGRGPAGSAS